MAETCPPGAKSEWPELVGTKGEEASEIIMRENPYVKARLFKEGAIVTHDIRCDQVRVWISESHIVTRVPIIG